MENKLNFTEQALKQINMITKGEDKKFLESRSRRLVVQDLNIILILTQYLMMMILFLEKHYRQIFLNIISVL